MRVVVTGATGFIGRAVVAALVARGDAVVALSRSPDRARGLEGASAMRFDPTAPDPAPFENADAVIHLAGETVAGRWSAEKKRAIFDSRATGTRNLVASLAACARPPRILIAASGAGYYGDRGDEPLFETSTPGSDFLADVCIAWEREAQQAERLGLRVALLRQGIVLGAGGGALEAMLPPFRAFAGGPYGNGSQWMPWIHLEDDVALLLFALDHDLRGPFNAVSPDIATSARFAQAIGHALRRPSLAFAPGPALRIVLGEFASTLLASQLVLPAKALDAGFDFKHEMLEPALLDVLAPGRGRAPAWHTFEDSMLVKAPLEKVFALISDAAVLERITPRALHFSIRTPQPVEMRRGAVLDYALKVRGLPIKWKTLISDWQAGVRFVDYQLKGPFLLWRHEHGFVEEAGGTLVHDRLIYSLPLAPLSDVALPLVRADLARSFEYRRRALTEIVRPE